MQDVKLLRVIFFFFYRLSVESRTVNALSHPIPTDLLSQVTLILVHRQLIPTHRPRVTNLLHK